MQKIQLEEVKMSDNTRGLLRVKQRSQEKDIIISVDMEEDADKSDNDILMENIKTAYMQYYSRISEYL